MSDKIIFTRQLVNIQDLRKQSKKEKMKEMKEKKGKGKPFINNNNKILLNDRVRLTDIIRGSNRTKYLIETEFMP